MSSRKLVRCVSTCSEDILDDALNELSHLNQRHAVLRQQLFARKNNRSVKYRPSGSLCSTSSSSSATSSSSMCSSFSSSVSATMSSSESWDSFSDTASDISMTPISSLDFPRVTRRLSKPKVNMFRPYCKPRRFSLQLVSHPESPETSDDLSVGNTSSVSPHFTVWQSVRSQPSPKYSRLMCEKENFSSADSPIKVKSNPTSPSKCDLSSVLLDNTFLQYNAISDRFMSNQMTAHCSPALLATSSQAMTSSGVLLIRSKSLDDLSLCSTNGSLNQPFFGGCQQLTATSSQLLPPKPSPSMATSSSCDMDNVLQRISTLQV